MTQAATKSEKTTDFARPAQLDILNEAQTAAFLGVSSRTLLTLRREPWFPAPLRLGPRATRWLRSELIEAVASRAPRGGVQQKPKHLVEANAARDGCGAPAVSA
jgi:predicted DNA-binding transcriptional regulator AlpA